jgi:hypothetical protein
MKQLLASLILTAASTAALASTYQWYNIGISLDTPGEINCVYSRLIARPNEVMHIPQVDGHCPHTVDYRPITFHTR